MKHLIGKWTLQHKILLGYLALLALVLLTNLLFYRRTLDETVRFNVSYMNQINSQLNLNIDVITSGIDRLNYMQYFDGQMRQILLSDARKKSASQKFTEDLYMQNALNHAFRMNPFFVRGTIINENGDIYCSVSSDIKEYVKYVDRTMREIPGEGNQAYYTNVHETVIRQKTYRVITILQKLYYYGAPLGVLSVDLNYDELTELFDQTYRQDNASAFFVVNKGRVIYQSPNAYVDLESLAHGAEYQRLLSDLEEVAASPEPTRTLSIGTTPCVISAQANKGTKWITVQYIPVSALYKTGFRGMSNLFVLMVIVFFFAVGLSIFLSKQTTKPLGYLIANMRSSKEGRVEQIAVPESIAGNEFGELMRNYNLMAQRINDNITATYVQELSRRRTQLKMLRYQINPHFMYNTLNTISALAEIEGVDDIVQISGSLSKILRYNVKGRDLVRLEDEIEYVHNYLQIQNIRFPGRYRIHIEISDAARACSMLKFLIQPILENAISHGLSDVRKGGQIEILADVQQDELVISVFDNGAGMSEDQLAEWNSRLSGEEELDPPEEGDDSIGLMNVNARIRGYYGSRYGLRIMSEEHVFTRVMLILGALREETGNPS